VDIFSSPFIPLIIHPRIQLSLQSSTFDLCSNIIQSFNIYGPFRSVSLFVVLRAGKGKGASIVNIPGETWVTKWTGRIIVLQEGWTTGHLQIPVECLVEWILWFLIGGQEELDKRDIVHIVVQCTRF
jgi:hypothetical protein